jgi:integrase
MKLTKTTVQNLPVPIAGQTLYWDEELRGFGIRIGAGGTRTYIAQSRVDGKARRITIGEHGRWTCDQARKEARLQLVAMDKGIDPRAEKKRRELISVSLRAVMHNYCRDRRTAKGGPLKPSTITSIEKHVNKSLSNWADKPITSITRDSCSAKFRELSERGPVQANQCFRILRALLNYAQETYRPGGIPILLENPVAILSGKKMWNPSIAKKTRIPNSHIGKVWKMLQARRANDALVPVSQTGADIVLFLILTGCRWSEAAQLTWDRVKLAEGYWYLPTPKNHNPVILPLSKAAREILTARTAMEGNDYVFPARSKVGHLRETRKTMDEVSEVAGVHLTPHDMRRTFSAIANQCGIELWKTKLLMNHVSNDVTITNYTETNDMRYLSAEAEKIAAWIEREAEIAL